MSPCSPGPDELLRYRPLVRRLSRVALRGSAEAEELEQQVWLRVLEHPPRHERGLPAWLYQVVRSVSSHMREGDRHRRAREQIYGERAPRVELPAELDRLQDHERLLATLARIDRDQALVLRLRFLEGRPPAEIAELLDLPVETVRTRLKRGLAQIRARLQAP
jgi:RNA polymerase sigma factor (sigma-70 family)